MTDLLMVRHAQSLWNAEGRWQGWADPPLTALGEEQAEEAGRTLGSSGDAFSAPDLIAASDLRRALRTAELLAAGLRASTKRPAGAEAAGIATDPDLREYDVGDWTGLRRSDIAERWPEELADWDAGRTDHSPGGEEHDRFVARLVGAIERLGRAVPTGRVIVVSHGRAIRAVADTLGAPDRLVGHLTGWHLRLAAAPALVRPVALLDASTRTGSTAARSDKI